MRTLACDVVVVGAGPGGSMAARYCAEGGLDTILIEKKAEVGAPLRCAEGVSKKWLQEGGIEPDPAWIRGDMKGAIIKSPQGTTFQLDESKAGAEVGYVLERHIFDKALARLAAEAGARIMLRTSCTGIIREEGEIVGIKARSMGEEIEIRAKCVVAADGYESQVGRWGGIDTNLKLSDIDSCIQYRMCNIDVAPDYCEFVIGSVAPGGYIWIFPKGNGVANVGIGVMGRLCKGDGDAGSAAGVVERQLDIGGEGLAAGQLLDLGEQERGDLLAVDVGGIGQRQRLIDDAFHIVEIEGIFIGNGVADKDAAGHFELQLGFDDAGDLLLALGGVIDLEAAFFTEEGGEVLGAVADDGDAHRFEVFQRSADIEDLLGAGADDRDGGTGQLLQVGRDIHGDLAVAVDAADAAGGKHPDARKVGAHHGSGDGGGTGFSGGEIGGEIAAGDLADIFTAAHDLQLLRGEADFDFSADKRHGGGMGAAGPDLLFDLGGEGEVFGVGHSVAQDRAFQCDDRLAVFQRHLQFRLNIEILLEIHNNSSFLSHDRGQIRLRSSVSLTKESLMPGWMVSGLRTATTPDASA